MKKLFRKLGIITSYIIPYRITHILTGIYNAFSNGYNSRRFKKFGDYSTMAKPLIIRNLDCVTVGHHTSILQMGTITAIKDYFGNLFTPSIKIGNYCSLGKFIHITAINNIEIGNNVLIGNFVTITDHGHGTTNDIESLPPLYRPLYSKGKVVIEDNVWIGDKCTILPGVTIGKGSVIGSNTVVTKDIPSYSIVTGSAGSIKKY